MGRGEEGGERRREEGRETGQRRRAARAARAGAECEGRGPGWRGREVLARELGCVSAVSRPPLSAASRRRLALMGKASPSMQS